MAYDEELAERVRTAMGPVPGVTEIKMFGGICFTVGGNMAVGVNADNLMVRLAPDDGEQALSEPGARPMDFTGRPMRGFLFVGPDGYADDALDRWVSRSVAFASSLPPKPKTTQKAKKPTKKKTGS